MSEQKKLNFMLQKGKDVEIDGYKGFIFMAKSGRPLMPSAINNILYNIVDVYNKKKFKLQKLNIEMLNCYQRYLLALCDIRLVPEWQKRE